MEALREQVLVLITMPLYFLVIGIELLLSHFKKTETYTLQDTAFNFYFMILNAAVDVLFRAAYVLILLWFYNHRIITPQQGVFYWLLLIILEDLAYYWLHRTDHHCRLFWAVHVTHHSSEKMNFSVGFRSSVFEPLYRFLFFIPIAFLGFQPLDIVFIYSATQIWGIIVHTEKVGKLGFLEKIFVTPTHHRIHHASNPRYLDKNLGMFLIIWDKLFGTFVEEDPRYDPLHYGLTEPVDNHNLFTSVFHEWISMWKDIRQPIPFKQKLAYIFREPGWSHDGSRHTSKRLREEEEKKLAAEADAH